MCCGVRHRERGVVQPRPAAVGEHDVVRIALALQEHEHQVVGVVGRDELGEPEAEIAVELAGLRHLGRENLEMIDPQRAGAVVLLELHDQPRLHRLGGAEFERRADRVGDVQRAALVRHLDPFRRQAGALEHVLGLVEILLGVDPQADALAGRFAVALLEHDAVVAGLLHAAQIERLVVLVADREAEAVDVEGAAAGEVLHRPDDVARPRGVERRGIGGARNGHGLSLCVRGVS